MSHHRVLAHTIRIAAPIQSCQRFFTPAGEELWVDGWRPSYLHPADGRTERGMVFTTGSGEDFTIWSLVDFDTEAHYARYTRVTPSSRSGFVEVHCVELDPGSTAVTVSYTLTALTPAGVTMLAAFDAPAFADMIEGWRVSIEARLPQLLAASIR